jgi:enoyl-CoA hydratase
MSDDVLFSQEQHIGFITLNRAKALNALTLPMILALQEQLSAWLQDASIHAVVIKAAEGKAFCAGGDVRWLYEKGLAKDAIQMDFFWHEYRLNHFIHSFSKPYIALMDGITMGGGVGVSLHGSHRVASGNFSCAMPETAIGFFPDIGASHLLSRCPDEYGTYLALTGQRIKADDAQLLGLVEYNVASDDIDEIIAELVATNIGDNPHQQVDYILKKYSRQLETFESNEKLGLVKDTFQHATLKDIYAHLRSINSQEAQVILSQLEGKAPLSLCVTLLQMKKAATMVLKGCLDMDFNLVNHFMLGHDFYEGVRALLVDKDKSPQWDPATLDVVSDEQVLAYFEATSRGLGLD